MWVGFLGSPHSGFFGGGAVQVTKGTGGDGKGQKNVGRKSDPDNHNTKGRGPEGDLSTPGPFLAQLSNSSPLIEERFSKSPSQ